MKWLLGLLLIGFVLLGSFLLSPSPVDSTAWDAPPPPALTGKLAPNERLRLADLLARGQVYGPEDTTVGADGVLYTGTQDGKIVRVWPDGRVENWLDTSGRPLGMVFDAGGNLIVADAWKGLLSIAPDGGVTLLSRESEGLPFGFTDDVDIAPDGRIYFTDASSRFEQPDYVLDLRTLDLERFARFIHEHLLPNEHVAQVRSEIVLRTVKDDPGFDLGHL